MVPADVSEPVRLTEWTRCGGCAAKWGAAQLRELVDTMSSSRDSLLVGLAPSDDAAVVRLARDLALVSTTDFFPPLVDDPDDFGTIAAANACSDLFAMGASVTLALNIAAFPEELPVSAIKAILSAAARTVEEAGGVVAGGHTIRSEEPIFGLAVQGTVHPERIWTKGGGVAGDAVVLSKPLGTGVALAGDHEPSRREAIAGMRTLNAAAADVLREVCGDGGPHACTDVTGFGLFVHAWEMAERGDVSIRLYGDALPAYTGVRELIVAGVRTGGDHRNRQALEGRLRVVRENSFAEVLGFDPQTSGGLLAAVPPHCADALVAAGYWVIGEIGPGPAVIELD